MNWDVSLIGPKTTAKVHMHPAMWKQRLDWVSCGENLQRKQTTKASRVNCRNWQLLGKFVILFPMAPTRKSFFPFAAIGPRFPISSLKTSCAPKFTCHTQHQLHCHFSVISTQLAAWLPGCTMVTNSPSYVQEIRRENSQRHSKTATERHWLSLCHKRCGETKTNQLSTGEGKPNTCIAFHATEKHCKSMRSQNETEIIFLHVFLPERNFTRLRIWQIRQRRKLISIARKGHLKFHKQLLQNAWTRRNFSEVCIKQRHRGRTQWGLFAEELSGWLETICLLRRNWAPRRYSPCQIGLSHLSI